MNVKCLLLTVLENGKFKFERAAEKMSGEVLPFINAAI